MKKILIFLAIYLSVNICYSADITYKIDIREYIDKPYVGMSYQEALNNKLPFILIIAKPDNALMMAKLIPIAEMVYNNFQGEYNFCIINAKVKENNELVKFFNPTKTPATYIIDTQNRTYTYIGRKYYNKRDIKKILIKFKNGTLFY